MGGSTGKSGLLCAFLAIGMLPTKALGAAVCLEFDEASLKTRLQIPALIESSGLACSRQFQDLLLHLLHFGCLKGLPLPPPGLPRSPPGAPHSAPFLGGLPPEHAPM